MLTVENCHESKSCFHSLSLHPQQTEYGVFKALLIKAFKYDFEDTYLFKSAQIGPKNLKR